MPTPTPTVDELVATLSHSTIPTLLVEGTTDAEIYRWLEGLIGVTDGNVLPCGGRQQLLAVFARRAEYSALPTAFLADRDMWLFSGVPDGLDRIIWTEGYSIENDIYADSSLEALLTDEERGLHRATLATVIEWFAFEVEEWRAGRVHRVGCSIHEVLEWGGTEMRTAFRTERGWTAPSRTTVQDIQGDYRLRLRGKNLFEVLVRYLSASGRSPKHSQRGLLEIALKLQGPLQRMLKIASAARRDLQI